MVWKPFKKIGALSKRIAVGTVAAAKQKKIAFQKKRVEWQERRAEANRERAEARYRKKSTHHLGHAKNLAELEMQLDEHNQKMRYPQKIPLPQQRTLEARARAIAMENLIKEVKNPQAKTATIRSQAKLVESYRRPDEALTQVEKMAMKAIRRPSVIQKEQLSELKLLLQRYRAEADHLKAQLGKAKTAEKRRELREKWEAARENVRDVFKLKNELEEKVA